MKMKLSQSNFKNPIENLSSRLDQTEKRLSGLENKGGVLEHSSDEDKEKN
jgi:hypothetical protein